MRQLIIWLNILIKRHRELKKWRRAVMTLAAVITFATTYALILPAITVEKNNADAVSGMYLEYTAGQEKPEDILDEDVQEGVLSLTDEENSEEQSTGMSTESTVVDPDEIVENAPAAPVLLSASGTDYSVNITCDETSGVPSDAALDVSEIPKGTEEYELYLQESRKAIGISEDDISRKCAARFFDIKIMVDGVEFRPESGVTVEINCEPMAESLENEINTLHFADETNDAEVVETTTAEVRGDGSVAVEFQTESFSVYGIVGTELVTEWTISTPDGEEVTMLVTVTYGPEAMIPEGSRLVLTEYEEGGDEYQHAREVLLNGGEYDTPEDSESAEYLTDDNGEVPDDSMRSRPVIEGGNGFDMLAFDISILDQDGNEVEPEASVDVDLKLKQLPDGVDREVLASSLTVAHFAENDGDISVEVVAGEFYGASGEVNILSDSAEIGFSVDGFSTFTINWRQNNNTRTATVHYVNESGRELTVSNSNFRGNNLTQSPAFLIYDIDGYEYARTTLGSIRGTEIKPMLRYYNNRWQYSTNSNTSSPNWSNLDYNTTSNRDIYVVYKEKPTPAQGGVPKIEENGEKPGNPAILKESESNENGTNTLSLSVTGRTAPTRVLKLADVIVIFDVSGSMNQNMAGDDIYGQDANDTAANSDHNSRLYLAYQAASYLANNLLSDERVNSNGEKLIRMSLISFSNQAAKVSDFTDDPATFINAVGGLKATGGTNWEAALRLANREFKRAQDPDNVQDNELDPNRATFVIFVTDGAPTFRLTRYDLPDSYNRFLTNDGQLRDIDQSFYRVYGVYGGGTNDTYERNYNAALAESQSIVGSDKILYSVGISGTEEQLDTLKTLTTASGAEEGEEEGSHSVVSTTESMLLKAFEDIAESITGYMGWADFKMTDGITDLSSTVMEKSSLLGVDDDFTYWRAAPPSEWSSWDEDLKNAYVQGVSSTSDAAITYPDEAGGWTAQKRAAYANAYNLGKNATFTQWNPVDDNCNTADYVNGAVQWDMGDKFILQDGYSYKVTFSVWPSQEAYDWLANLKNGTKTWADVVAAGINCAYGNTPAGENPQIVNNGDGTFSLATNKPGAKTTYKTAVKTGNSITTSGPDQELSFNEVPPMPLVPEKITVKKDWDYEINASHAAVSLNFRLKVGDLYYQNDGSFRETADNAKVLDIENHDRTIGDKTIPAWTNSIDIAPGIVIFDEEGKAKILETGHKYGLEEFGVVLDGEDTSQFDGSYEFTSQIVRPMVLTDVDNGGTYAESLVYLVLVNDDNPLPSGAKTYTLDGEVYYAAVDDEGNALKTLTGTNHRKAELDITKRIINNTGTDVSKDTFTYKVTLTVPDDADLSLITAWEYVQNTVSETNPPNTTLDGYQAGEHPITGDEERFQGHIFRYATISYGRDSNNARVPIKEGFTSIGNGKKRLVMYVSLLSNEVLRFTNLPTKTEYEIEEIYANYRQACTSRDIDAPADAEGNDKDNNVAEQGYSVSWTKKAVGEEVGQEVSDEGMTILGTIDTPDTRYYNQFTNTLGFAVDAELQVTKHLDGYEWTGERYYFTLTAGTASYTDGVDPTEGTSPMPNSNRIYISSPSGSEDKTYTFGKIRYIRPGTYTYTIAETDAAGNVLSGTTSDTGITYGDAETVTVTVGYNNQGKLVISDIVGSNGNTSKTSEDGTSVIVGTTRITNSVEQIIIRKVDSRTRQKVGGAVFEISMNHQKLYISSTGMLLSAAQVAEKIGMPVDAEGAEDAMAESGIASTFTIGEITLRGIEMGETYTLNEKSAPSGYIITGNDAAFTVSKDQGEISITATGANVTVDGITLEIENAPGAALPNAGGIGTTMFYLLGALVVACAGMVLMMRKFRRIL